MAYFYHNKYMAGLLENQIYYDYSVLQTIKIPKSSPQLSYIFQNRWWFFDRRNVPGLKNRVRIYSGINLANSDKVSLRIVCESDQWSQPLTHMWFIYYRIA